jgi:hypothetical protein
MVSVSLGPDGASAAKDAVRDAVAAITRTSGRADGLPYKAAHHLYQISGGKITHDETWTATQQAIQEMIGDGELIEPTGHGDSWKIVGGGGGGF